MDWEKIRSQLESILQAPLYFTKIPLQEWNVLAADQWGESNRVRSVIWDHQAAFMLYKEGTQITILAVEKTMLTESERRLVELMLESMNIEGMKMFSPIVSDEQRRAQRIGDWIKHQLEQDGVKDEEMPDSLAAQPSFYQEKVPILLYGDYSDNKQVSYAELKKLLASFFGAEIVLIPLLEKEWLILGATSLLEESSVEDKDTEEESVEEALTSIGFGLYEMLENEWVGECHLSIYYPIYPMKSLVETVTLLREAIHLGRSFHVGHRIHLPWGMQLEKMLDVIPESAKKQFLKLVLGDGDPLIDTEMLMTLEQFIAMDCNVSETAKKLYIHRNTLLYRLDKFKHETGLDARTFNHAVLIKIALLLYKVTKRK